MPAKFDGQLTMGAFCIAVWLGLPLVAAFIAHRKQRSRLGALLLIFVAPPIGLLVVLLTTPRSEGEGNNSTKARCVFGLAPFWIALTVLLVGGATTSSSEYWNAAPWLLVAAIPASLVSLLLVEVFMCYRRTRN